LKSSKEEEPFLYKNNKYENGLEITDVFQNSTAMKAGLKPGDIILEIDGHKVSDLTFEQTLKLLIKQEPGNPVQLIVVNTDRKTLTHQVEEKIIERQKLTYDLDQFIMGQTGKFSPDSKYLASFYFPPSEESLELRNLLTKKLIKINHQATIIDVFFSPDSKLIATTSTDYSVKIWNVSGNLISSIKLQQFPNSLAFSPNSQQVAVLGQPNELSVWSIDGKQIAKYTVPEEGQGQIVFSPDGKYIATGGGKVLIWRLEKNLDDLLSTGCDWLKEYFVTHPQDKERLKVCQDHPKSK
jgi:hypothetical protein